MLVPGNKRHTVDMMLKSTSFTSQDLFPFVSSFQQVHSLIKDNVTKQEVGDIFKVLYPDGNNNLYQIYLKTFDYRSMEPSITFMTHKLYNRSIENGFIAVEGHYNYYSPTLFPFHTRGIIFCNLNNNSNNDGNSLSNSLSSSRPQVISGDVAAYYQIPVSAFKDMWWYCPQHKPYLNVSTYKGKFSVCCVLSPDTSFYNREFITIDDNKFDPNDGFNTGIKIEDYELMSLNAPSTYGRLYNLYRVLLTDPISKKLFAISI